jgi:hypothetical protein
MPNQKNTCLAAITAVVIVLFEVIPMSTIPVVKVILQEQDEDEDEQIPTLTNLACPKDEGNLDYQYQ